MALCHIPTAEQEAGTAHSRQHGEVGLTEDFFSFLVIRKKGDLLSEENSKYF